jgi:hypothetical protein
MKDALLNLLMGCRHEFSWPRKLGSHYYQVCLLCGTEYQYDWKRMKRSGRPVLRDRAAQRHEQAKRIQARERHQWKPRERRIPYTASVQYRLVGGRSWHDGTIENISRSGFIFACEEGFERGKRLELTFEMPQEISGKAHASVVCTATVARYLPAMEENGPCRIAVVVESCRALHEAMSVTRALAQEHAVRRRG